MAAPILIVGGGHGAASVASFLRQYGCADPILIVGQESHLPYQRPPLSKEWLTEDAKVEEFFLRNDRFYRNASIELKLETEVTRIAPGDKCVHLSSGEKLPYGTLVIATGARARKLDFAAAGAPNVLALRDITDAIALKRVVQKGRRIAIIGGGYVGLEVAASAIGCGAEVSILEREERLLARVASPELSKFFEAMHLRYGVLIKKSVQIMGFEVKENAVQRVRVSHVQFSHGDSIDCDAVLVGIGAIPNDDIARDAGLSCDGGIIVNEKAQTSEGSVYAIGDCTRRPIAGSEKLHRLESVPNVLEQAKQAAAAICGRKAPEAEVPWFWSTQYKKKLQIAGISEGAPLRIVRENPDRDAFCVFHLDKSGHLRCVEAFNAPIDFAAGRKLIAARAIVSEHLLRDPSVALSDCATGRSDTRRLAVVTGVKRQDGQAERLVR